MDRRRFLLTSLAGAVAAPLATEAQQPNVPRIGLLSVHSPSDSAVWDQAFRRGLRDLGWIEGTNVSIEYRYAEGRPERLHALATDLVRLSVAVIVAAVTPDAFAARKATSTIPIVMVSPGDPVATGLVEHLARPGGNITGLSQISPQLAGKRLALLKEIAPKLSRVAVLWNPDLEISTVTWSELQSPARDLGVHLYSAEVRRSNDLDDAFDRVLKARAGALAILPGHVFLTNLKRIADFALAKRLPSTFHLREFADSGGLLSYAVDRAAMFRRSAVYVDKILKGAKPADLPIEQPTKFELVINLKTAKALGLVIPPALLLRADHVIE